MNIYEEISLFAKRQRDEIDKEKKKDESRYTLIRIQS